MRQNLETQITNLRKLATTSQRESPAESHPKFEFRLERFVATQQLIFNGMMSQKQFTLLIEIAKIVEQGCFENKLPKFTFADYAWPTKRCSISFHT